MNTGIQNVHKLGWKLAATTASGSLPFVAIDAEKFRPPSSRTRRRCLNMRVTGAQERRQ